jgi:16S rRNA (guanine527-N7)-methyltransferase
MLNLLTKYFPQLTDIQKEQFEKLFGLYSEWNEKINVISRKDIEYLEDRHILHSLAIARIISFNPGARILDIGTGGGFPGIPLAIFFPEVKFHLVDSIGKKIKVVQEIINTLGLTNATSEHCRAEELKDRYDFVVSRAVAPLHTLIYWTAHLIRRGASGTLPNGWIFLKGGELDEEVKEAGIKIQKYPISDFFQEEFFENKYVIFSER